MLVFLFKTFFFDCFKQLDKFLDYLARGYFEEIFSSLNKLVKFKILRKFVFE